jgi:hypothetical protein
MASCLATASASPNDIGWSGYPRWTDSKRRETAPFAMVAGGRDARRGRALAAGGLVHLAAAAETNWHGFACAIVEGLRGRGINLAAERVLAIRSEDDP